MKWLTLLFALFLGAIIVLANTGKLAILSLTNLFPNSDKAGHFILYGVLALLVNLTVFRSFPRHGPVWIAFMTGLVLCLLIGLEEWSQQLLASRTFSFLDLAASYLGVIFFSLVAVRTKPQSYS